MINKKFFWILSLAVLMVSSEIACSKASVQEASHDETASSGPPKASDQTGEAGPKGRGRDFRGTQKEPPGRGLGRAIKNFVLLELSPEETKAVNLKAAKVGRRPMRNQLRAMGKVLVPQTKKAIVSYPFPARISDIHAQIGDWVESGQKLVTLQSEEVGNARAEFFKAQADFELARRNLEREKTLFDRGVGAQKNLLTTEAEFKVSEAVLDAAEKKLHVLGFTEGMVQELEKTHQINPTISLHAPIGGKVIASTAVRGAMVNQDTEILVLMDPTVLWIEAEIYERDIAKIKIGQDVEVSVPAYPGEAFPGKISYVGDVMKEDSRTITVRTEIRNKEYKLKPGMFSDMVVFLNHPDEVLAVPEAAVLDDRDRKIVFVSVAEGYRLQPVRVGIKEGGYWEVLEGLAEGDEVVIAGNYQLKSKLYEELLHSSHVH
jgi:cobalt-zinc-cadmium efflux system membrane fusion protein